MNPMVNKCLERLESKRKALVEDGIPVCFYCGKRMKNYTPTHGKFKGQKQEHSFVCDCEKFPKKMIISVG